MHNFIGNMEFAPVIWFCSFLIPGLNPKEEFNQPLSTQSGKLFLNYLGNGKGLLAEYEMAQTDLKIVQPVQ